MPSPDTQPAACACAFPLAEVQRVAILDWDVHSGNGIQARPSCTVSP
jgi:hypothetical protein